MHGEQQNKSTYCIFYRPVEKFTGLMEKKRRMTPYDKKKKIRWKQYLPIYLLALPGILYMICNNYLPMFGIVIAFKS